MDQPLDSVDTFAMSVGYGCWAVLLVSEQILGKLSPNQVRFSSGSQAVQLFEFWLRPQMDTPSTNIARAQSRAGFCPGQTGAPSCLQTLQCHPLHPARSDPAGLCAQSGPHQLRSDQPWAVGETPALHSGQELCKPSRGSHSADSGSWPKASDLQVTGQQWPSHPAYGSSKHHKYASYSNFPEKEREE